jgi:hypothetical protein
MLRRRLITVPGYVLAWLLWLGAAPIWLPLAFVVDVVRRNRGVALRSATFVSVYLTCEILGMAASGILWAWKGIFRVDAERWIDIHFRLEAWWGSTLFRAVVRLFGLRIEVEGDADLARGPYLLLVRHASSGDTLLASALVSKPHGVRLRYVLKRELLWDGRMQELARDLGPRDGILIYPEGTRFSEAKRRRALDRFHENGDAKMVEYARSLARVLPPRPGGTLGLLEAAPAADVVFCAHTGFEGAASLAEIWKGALMDQTIRVQFCRIPRDEIPAGRDARIAWVFEEWQRVDAWIESQQLREFSGK